MKHIIKLGVNKYIQLDSYETRETPLANVCVGIIAVLIAALTIGAMVGVDITNPAQPNHVHRIGY
jgi:hypothetical protein